MSRSERSAEDVSADVYDFVADYMDDRETGRVRPLREYLERYTGAEAEIAAEYLRLTGRAVGDSPETLDLPDDPSRGRRDEQFVGRYRLLRLLGRGGQGEVWLALDESLGREVALKLLTALFLTEERRARFRREAESIARLAHPGLADVLEANMDGATPYIAMHHVEGVDLGTSFEQARAQTEAAASGAPAIAPVVPWEPRTRSDLRRVLRFFERCARALHAAHQAGVVHRDVKPGNIMVTPDGEPVLLDFGLARDEVVEGDSDLTREGDVFGTLAYMSPEQLRGASAEIDHRTDIWSLGVTLFEALTGDRPFAGKGPGELAIAIDSNRSRDPQVLNPVVTTDVRVVLSAAIERSRERRYPDALALADDLRRICEYEPIKARPAGRMLRVQRWCRREPAWAAALTVTLVALVGGLIASLAANRHMQLLLDSYTARRYCAEVPAFQAKAPAGALALGLEAVAMEDTWATRSALYPPLLDLTLDKQLELPERRVWDTVFLDDTRVAACGADGALRIFDLSTGEPVVRDFDADLRSLVVATSAGLLVVGDADGLAHALLLDGWGASWSVRLGHRPIADLVVAGGVGFALVGAEEVVAFDPGDGRSLQRFDAPAGGVGALRASADGRRVIVVGRAFHGAARTTSTEVLLIDVAELGVIARLEHTSPARDAVIDNAHRRIVTVDADGRLRVFGLDDGEAIDLAFMDGALATLGVSCASLAMDRAGTTLAVGTDGVDESHVVAFDIEGAGDHVSIRPSWSAPSGQRVVDLSFSPDGRGVATASWDARVRVFDRTTGAMLAEHIERNRPMTVAWSPTGDTLVSIGIWRTVEVWRTRPRAIAFRIPMFGDADLPSSAFAWGDFTHDGERVALRDMHGRIAILETPTERDGGELIPGALVARFDPVDGEPALCAVMAQSAPVVVWFCRGGMLRCVDTSTGLVVAEVRVGPEEARDRETFECRSIAVSGDGSCVALVDGDGRAWTWRPGAAPHRVQPPRPPDAPPVMFQVVAFGTESHIVFLADDSAAVLRHDVDDAARSGWFERVPDAGGPALDIAVSATGNEVVVASQQDRLQCWDTATGQATRQPGRLINRRWVEYFGDGRILSAARGAETAVVVGTKQRVKQAIPHDDYISSCAVGPTGRIFATGSLDGTVFVWDAGSGTASTRAAIHAGPVHSVATAMGSEGVRVLSCAADGAAIWPVDVLAAARMLAPRGLSTFEEKELKALVHGE